jgi:hypothetical protein
MGKESWWGRRGAKVEMEEGVREGVEEEMEAGR